MSTDLEASRKQFVPVSSFLLPLKPKYLPQHRASEHHLLCISLNMTDQVSHPVQNNRQNYYLYVSI